MSSVSTSTSGPSTYSYHDLCFNRPEGFGPSSSISAPIPTSCFLDVILVPLLTWLYLLLLIALLYYSRRSDYAFHPPSVPPPKSRDLCRKITLSVYYILLVAQLLMTSLEIARLALAKLGIGLLPFTYISFLVAMGMRATGGLRGMVRGYSYAACFVWAGLTVMFVLKIAGEVKEGINGRKDTKYPIVDQVTDLGVMAGVSLILLMLEIILGEGDRMLSSRRQPFVHRT